MKIIHVVSCLSKGGGERVVVELANKGAENGDEITIIAGWPVNPDYLQNHLSADVNIKFVGRSKNLAYLKILPWLLKNKKWIINQDVLHCHLTYGSVFGAISFIILKKLFQKKTPLIVETNHAVGMPVPKFNRWLHSRMVLLRDGLILIGKDPYWNNFILKHPALNTVIIPNGISLTAPYKDIILQNKFRKEKGIPESCKYIVGTVSMLRPDRKPWLYIPIFRDVYQALGTDVKFILAGDGIESERIKIDIEKMGLSEHVYMPGFINNPLIIISNMDIYVSVSVGETAGISMIEAAMCKVPVVAIQMIENYTAKNNDWVWSHTDIKKVAEKIIHILQNAGERNKLAEIQNKYVIKNFGAEAMYSSYKLFYTKIAAARKNSS